MFLAGKKRRYVVDKCDGRGETALHKAAIKGDIQKVKFLLRHGANPNHQDYAGE
jgi:ankyrin repeat protein